MLRHCDRLVAAAIEEVVEHLPVPRHEFPHNAARMEKNQRAIIGREATPGSQPSTRTTVLAGGAAAILAVLLRPGLPVDLAALEQALSGFAPETVAGLRRRPLYQPCPSSVSPWNKDVPEGSWPPDYDRDLYLLQTDGETPPPNHPADVAPPEQPYVMMRLRGSAWRRRNMHYCPPPSWQCRRILYRGRPVRWFLL